LAGPTRAGEAGIRTLVYLQVGAAIAPLLLCAVFEAVTPAAFPVLALLCGMLGGYEFPVAARIFCARNPGTLYALDLAGAAWARCCQRLPDPGVRLSQNGPAGCDGEPGAGADGDSFGAGKTSAVKRKISVSGLCQQFLDRPAL